MPDDIVPMAGEIPPISREIVTKIVNEFVKEWNAPGMDNHISTTSLTKPD